MNIPDEKKALRRELIQRRRNMLLPLKTLWR